MAFSQKRGHCWPIALALVLFYCGAAGAARHEPIGHEGMLILVRSTLLALNDANETGNYTVLRDLGAPGFQANTAARLGEIFAALRRSHVDLSAVAVLDPQVQIVSRNKRTGMLRIAGFFPSRPVRVDFDLLFQVFERHWRLFGISVSLAKAHTGHLRHAR